MAQAISFLGKGKTTNANHHHTPVGAQTANQTPTEAKSAGAQTTAPDPPPGQATPKPTQPRSGSPLSRTEMEAAEASIVAQFPMISVYRQQMRLLDNEGVEAVAAGRAANPENVRRVESFVNAERYAWFFPRRNAVYTYENWLKAIAKFPAYCGLVDNDEAKSLTMCKKTIAISFAHFAQETGENSEWVASSEGIPIWRQALFWVREDGHTEGGGEPPLYTGSCSSPTFKDVYVCVEGRSYFGRGSKQLSHSYNYGSFSIFMYGNPHHLLATPALVADTWLALSSAVWFFMMPQPPKPSMQSVMDGSFVPSAEDRARNLLPGFGLTTNIINGGKECGIGQDNRASNRARYYREFAREFEVPIPAGEDLQCTQQGEFGHGSGGAVRAYIGRNWSGAFCISSTWDQGFSLLKPGDYERCTLYFNPGRPIV
eukprot:Filipodium_phascolosomae@DN2023_c0_g1_i1.p1